MSSSLSWYGCRIAVFVSPEKRSGESVYVLGNLHKQTESAAIILSDEVKRLSCPQREGRLQCFVKQQTC